jgi:hypothetical protein
MSFCDRRVVLWVALAFSALVALSSHAALATPAGNEPEANADATHTQSELLRAEAQAYFKRGLDLANEGRDWDAALSEFLRSRQLFPTRSATRNAAIALRKLERFAEALDMYDALLTQFSESISAQELAQARSERAALLEHVGELGIDPAEAGSNVVIDGQQRAVTPLAAPIRLDMGVHTVRLSKDGFQTIERQVSVAEGSARVIDGRLRPQLGTGTLVVDEANAEPLDVVVDAAVVGSAPWRGNVAAGLHSVLLRGDKRGTPPIAVDVAESKTVTLSLRATVLDAEAVVRPDPPSSTIFVDGVFVGSGAWSGALPSGLHRFEVVAPGRLPFRADVMLRPSVRATVQATLTANRPEPDPVSDTSSRLYVEPSIGLLLSRTLRGGIDSTCGCDSRSRPFGWLGGARIGYALLEHLGVEVSGGYLSLSESAVRRATAVGDPGTSLFQSRDFHDALSLSGPFAALGASARFFHRMPLTTRFAVGIASLMAQPSNSGTFTGTVTDAQGQVEPLSGPFSVAEPSSRLYTPFVSSEVRLGYRFTDRLSIDLGIALLAFFPPPHADRVERRAELNGVPEKVALAGVLEVPNETVATTFLTASPSVALRIEF